MRPKCVVDPHEGQWLRSLHSKHVEAHGMGRELSIPGNEYRGCANNLALFAGIHGLTCRDKFRGGAKSNFDECQAVAVQHDQVDFAAATTEVACDGLQPSRDEVL